MCYGWSGRRDSNPRLSAWEANTLPLSYARKINNLRDIITWTVTKTSQFSHQEADTLPPSYARKSRTYGYYNMGCHKIVIIFSSGS